MNHVNSTVITGYTLAIMMMKSIGYLVTLHLSKTLKAKRFILGKGSVEPVRWVTFNPEKVGRWFVFLRELLLHACMSNLDDYTC